MPIEELESLWSRIRRNPRRSLPWVGVAILLTAATSLLDEGVRRVVFSREPAQAPIVLDSRLAQVLRERTDLAHELGSLKGDPVASIAVVQPFENGFMVWTTEEPDAYLVCFNDTERSCQRFGASTLSKVELANYEAEPAEVKDLFNPTGGFRTTWIHGRLRQRLGLPLVPEKGFHVLIQRFEHGLLIRDMPWFRREDKQFLSLPDLQPVLAISDGSKTESWTYVGKYGA